MSCEIRYFRLPLEEVGYVRFIVEGYQGLAQVSAIPGRGEIAWLIPNERTDEAESLYRALREETGLVEIPVPDPTLRRLVDPNNPLEFQQNS